MNLTGKKLTKFSMLIVTAIFYILIILHTCVYFVILSPYLFIPYLFSSKVSNEKRIRKIIITYGKWVLKYAMFPLVKVRYYKNMSEDPAPSIIVSNHRSASDAYLMALLGRDAVMVVSDWPFNIPILGKMAKHGGYIQVSKYSEEEMLEKVKGYIQRGVNVICYPEGTRSGGKNIGQFHTLMFQIALELKCPIIPLCIVGNEEIPNKNFIVKPGTIKVKPLDSIYFKDYGNMSAFKLKQYIRDIIAAETSKMDRGEF